VALTIYRAEEGTKVRGTLTFFIGSLLFYGIYSLYNWLAGGWWSQKIPGLEDALGTEFSLDYRLLIVLPLLIGAVIGLYYLYNNKRWADFLVETEAEMKKVSWATRRQVVNESMVVVLTVLVLAIYIFSVDFGVVTVQRRVPNWILGPQPSATVVGGTRPAKWDDIWNKLFGS
jgi:preprotein translocase SecE subunit